MEISIKWNMCRVCLKPNNELKFLFNDAKFIKQIQECTGTLISSNDGLPDKICNDCIKELDFAHQFVCKFKKSEKQIKSVVERTLSTTSFFGKRKNGGTDEEILSQNDAGVDNESMTIRLPRPSELITSDLEFNPRKYVKLEHSSPEHNSDIMGNTFSDCSTQDVISNMDETTEDSKLNILYKDQEESVEHINALPMSLEEANSLGEADDIEEVYMSATQLLEKPNSVDSKNGNDYIIVLNDDKRKQKFNMENNSHFVECVADDDNENMICEEAYNDLEEEGIPNTNESQISNENNVYIMSDLNNIENLIEEDQGRVDEEEIEETHTEVDNDETTEIADNNTDKTETKQISRVLKQRQLTRPMHKLVGVSAHICEVCGNSFTTRSLLKCHQRLHRNEKKYECELCFKRFTASSNLTAHMRIHTGEKPYECQFCGRRFTDRSTHIKHERIHTNERPFTCNICGKSFTLSNTLKAHEVVHSDEKPHKCTVCAKAFKLPHQLKAHMNTHSHKFLSEEIYQV